MRMICFMFYKTANILHWYAESLKTPPFFACNFALLRWESLPLLYYLKSVEIDMDFLHSSSLVKAVFFGGY
jgi:hypothetical protein